MEIRLLVSKHNFEVQAKIITGDDQTRTTEILYSRLKNRIKLSGIGVPQDLRTEEMIAKKKFTLHLTDLEQDPHFFTQIFEKVLCEGELVPQSCYWSSPDQYIDADSEKKKKEEGMKKVSLQLEKDIDIAESKNMTFWEQIQERVDVQEEGTTQQPDIHPLHQKVHKIPAAKPFIPSHFKTKREPLIDKKI
ncbi:MAG: hypothetical protein QRY71_02630 [Candidatus Rhabdochlamydia sp.]